MKYYLLSLKHSDGDFLTWWRPDERGYCWSLDAAGLYGEEAARRIEASSTFDGARSVVAVPEGIAKSASYRVVECNGDNMAKLGASVDEWHKARRA